MTTALIAGQSNALGYGVTASELPAWYAPTSQVQIWSGSSWETMTPGVNTGTAANPGAWGPEVGFAFSWVADHPDETLFIVKSVKGSTGLAADANETDWSPDSDGELFDATTVKLAAAGVTPDVLLWFQGEQDAADQTKADAYAANLAGFKVAALNEWGVEQIVVGGISTELAFNDVVRAAQGPTAFDTDASAKQLDGLHFSGEGQISNGAAFYDAFVAQAAPDPYVVDLSGFEDWGKFWGW